MAVFKTKRIVMAIVFALAGVVRAAIVIDTVMVGNAGNAPDTRYEKAGFGRVDYPYSIGTYEVTAGQYAAFLNAVAGTDTYELYNVAMADPAGRWGSNIQRSGSSPNYSYSVAADWADRPVNFVAWGDSARFANWMHNGQPTGLQEPGTTETGSYDINGATSTVDLRAVTRQSGATWVLPSDDEWFKAAYHKNDGTTGNYFNYPTSSDSAPSNDVSNPDPGNNANFFQSGFTIGGPYYRTEVGEFENSESPYGTFDQGGNIWEWTEALSITARGLRGGTFNIGDHFLHASNSFHGSLREEFDNWGFRVAHVPEPTTVAMLTFGTLCALGRQRR